MLIMVAGLVSAQEQQSFPAGSSPAAIERMLKLAELRDGDVVIDLGSYDGRIVFAALRSHPGVRGLGVDIDGDWVRKANEAARQLGFGDRVQFLHQNAFDTDLSQVTVVTMWLFRSLTQLLRPQILAQARPGTRIIVNGERIDNHDMLGNWRPDVINRGAGDDPPVFLWIVPARVEGAWTWQLPIRGVNVAYDLLISQQFQVFEGFVRSGTRRENLLETSLRGSDISFSFTLTVPEGTGKTHHEFRGRVEGDRIKGTAVVTIPGGKPQELPWVAYRSHPSAWFRYTGVDLK
jgi:hypothetical protein